MPSNLLSKSTQKSYHNKSPTGKRNQAVATVQAPCTIDTPSKRRVSFLSSHHARLLIRRATPVPIYSYQCSNGHAFELRQSFSAEPQQECPECSVMAQRQIHAVGVIYKGSGFYTTDYARKSTDSSESSSSENSSSKSESPESKSESPESKSSSGSSTPKGSSDSKSESSSSTAGKPSSDSK